MVFPRIRQLDTRERLLKAMIDAVAQDGYAQVAVEHVLERSGASRSTFYEQFRDKSDCFLAAQRDSTDRLLRTLELEARLDDPSDIHETFIRVLVHFAISDRPSARVLILQALAAEPDALNAREEMVRKLERVIEKSWESAPEQGRRLDMPSRALVGCVLRVLSLRLGRGESALHEVERELSAWARSYSVPAGAPVHWRAASAIPCSASPRLSRAATPGPQPLPRGRHKLSTVQVARNQCDRILYAVAELSCEVGYAASTVTDICRRSRVSRKVFYTHYVDKRAAAVEAQERGYRQLVAASCDAFFSSGEWPERVWEAGRAFTGFLTEHSAVAWLGFVEPHAIGSHAIQRAEDGQFSFTMLLREGYRYSSGGEQQPPSTLEAIAASTFELIYQEIRRRQTANLAKLLPDVTYICLAPFIGPRAATEFIQSKLSATAT